MMTAPRPPPPVALRQRARARRIPGEGSLAARDHVAEAALAQGHCRAGSALAQAPEDLDAGARADAVPLDHLELVDPELGGQLGEAGLQGEGALGRPVALVGPGGREVGVVGLHLEARVVADEQGQALGDGVHGHGEAVLAVGRPCRRRAA